MRAILFCWLLAFVVGNVALDRRAAAAQPEVPLIPSGPVVRPVVPSAPAAPASGNATQGDEAALPPVIVTPAEEGPASAEPAGSSEAVDGAAIPTGPSMPAMPAGASPTPRTGRSSNGSSAGFPSLSQQQFGTAGFDVQGLNSVLRDNTSLFDSPQIGSIVDRPLLEERMSSDMARTLQTEVGVLMQQTARGQASPFVRGLTGEQILILVDGVRMNNAVLRAGPNQYFNTVDPGQVERIEVVRGAQSVLWGSDAIGGVINIVTRGADPNRGEYTGGGFTQYFSTADVGSYSRAHVEGWVHDQGLFAGGSYLNVNDLDRGGDRGRQPFTSYDQYAGDVKYNLVVNDSLLVTMAFSHFVQRDVPRSDRFAPFVLGPPANTPRPTFFNPQQRDFVYLRMQGLTTEGLLCDAYSFTVSYALTREGSTELRSPTQLEDGIFRDDTFGYQLTLARDLDDLGKLSYGADYYRDDVDARKFRTNPLNPNQAPSVRTPQFPDDAVADRAGLFLFWDVPITSRLHATPGVRYENANMRATPEFTINNVAQNVYFERTYQDWITSIGLVYEITDQFRCIGGLYEGYRAPTVDDLTANKTFLQNAQSRPELGSLNVQPEHSWTYEVGLKFDGDRLHYQVAQWWMQLDDYIARTVDNAGNQFLDNHDAYLYGTELSADFRLNDGWSLYGNTWYTFGRDNTLNEPFSRIPPLQGIAGLRWQDVGRTRYFDLYTWLVARQDRYNSVNLTDSRFPAGGNPGYGTLNLRMGRSWGCDCRHQTSLSLENITDKYYRVLGSGVDGPGFNAILGYQYQW